PDWRRGGDSGGHCRQNRHRGRYRTGGKGSQEPQSRSAGRATQQAQGVGARHDRDHPQHRPAGETARQARHSISPPILSKRPVAAMNTLSPLLASRLTETPAAPAVGKAREVREAFTQFVGETFYGHMLKSMRSTVGKPAYF